MKKAWIWLIIAIVLCVLATLTFGTTAHNLKYEAAQERLTISCQDHGAPNLRLLNPASGPIVVVDCEREK